jgi:hypothetical protein
MAHDHHDDGSGFSAGVLFGLILLILVLAVLFLYVGPNVFNVNVNVRSALDTLLAA